MPSITIINDNASISSSSSSTAARSAPAPSPSPVPASSSTVNIIPHNHSHIRNCIHRPPARRKSAISSWMARHVPRRVVLVLGLRRLAGRVQSFSPDCDCDCEHKNEGEGEKEKEEEAAESYAAFCNAFTASTSARDKDGCDRALTPISPPPSTPLPLPPPGVITPSLHVATEKPGPERGHKPGRCFGSLRSWCSRR
ncbi:hypothetical protein PHISP_06504 [Aspergillus sp. HF37]|nr:hypothetical protein PHISP_06504 [Aspergillus sp. HF37]